MIAALVLGGIFYLIYSHLDFFLKLIITFVLMYLVLSLLVFTYFVVQRALPQETKNKVASKIEAAKSRVFFWRKKRARVRVATV